MEVHNINYIVENINGATFLSIDSHIKMELSGGKKNVMKDKVFKTTKNIIAQAFTNQNKNGYLSMVNKRLLAEGKEPYTLKNRVWGTRIPNTPLVEHKGKYYLELIVQSCGEVTYQYEGKDIKKEEIEGLKTVKEAEQGGLEDKVIVRVFSLDSITSIKINGRVLEGKFIYE